ncbi:hypothetical protein AB4140_18720 [Shewanella sp. 10N.286.51.B2]|uniref:hypothetical protein n=1 Tax=Shewanella sp. 10N.286.51.B2 TaxID=3229707 RepID=UPI00354B5BA5
MSELNTAYRLKDLEKVLGILKSLIAGSGFVVGSDTFFDVDALAAHIKSIKQQIDQLELEITEMESEGVLHDIQNIDDIDAYFDSLSIKLSDELQHLKNELKNLVEMNEKLVDRCTSSLSAYV